MLILGIETSCDETSAAVVEDGRRILSNVVSSQVAQHARFGGVVPEIASRQHLLSLSPVVQQALHDAGIGVDDVEAVAVTNGPGLIGALLAGVSFAKAFAFARGIPLVGVDHIEGHIRACYLEGGEVPHPALALVVSGGTRTSSCSKPRVPTGCSARPATTPRARRTTSSPSGSASAIRAGRSSTGWRSGAT